MSLEKTKQFSHLIINNLDDDGTPQVIIAADANNDRILDFLRVTSDDDSQGNDWSLEFTLSDTGAANPRPVGRSAPIASANTAAIMIDMCARGNGGREDGDGYAGQTTLSGFGASGDLIPMDGLFIPAGAQVSMLMNGGSQNTDDFHVVASGRQRAV